MNLPVRLAALLAVSLLPLVTSHASAADARAGTSRRCPLTLSQQTSTGTLMNGQTSKVIQWSLTCTGLFTASASGGRIVLQTANGTRWETMQRGASITIPALGPGNYRLIVENIGQIRVNYRVRYRYGFG